MAERPVITRFAPSPTGFLQLGNYRTALFSYIYAHQHKGKFILRIEDTDKERSKKEYENNITESLTWLGLDFGNTFERQSERSHVYKKYIEKLIADGKAYVSKETVEEAGQRAEVIRFRNPKKSVTFFDEIRKEITMDTSDLGDFIIARSIEEPTFHLAVVVDDFEMGVTHIVRGEDHISNTPRQILIQQAIGAPTPHYAHLPLVLAPDRTKLSKRKGAKALTQYRDEGYLPEAIINYLALLGWNPGTDRELFTLDELITEFDLSKVQKSGAVFNEEKLKWYNKHYILQLSEEKLFTALKKEIGDVSDEVLRKIAPVLIERIQIFSEVRAMKERGEIEYLFSDPTYESKNLLFKEKGELSTTASHINEVIKLISDLSEEVFTAEKIKQTVWDYASSVGRGDVLWPMRFALSGIEKSPDPFTIAGCIGKEATLRRLEKAIALIG